MDFKVHTGFLPFTFHVVFHAWKSLKIGHFVGRFLNKIQWCSNANSWQITQFFKSKQTTLTKLQIFSFWHFFILISWFETAYEAFLQCSKMVSCDQNAKELLWKRSWIDLDWLHVYPAVQNIKTEFTAKSEKLHQCNFLQAYMKRLNVYTFYIFSVLLSAKILTSK